jgi:hypothetical protein
MTKKKSAGTPISDLKRKTKKQCGSQEKIRIEGMRGEVSVAELCRQDGTVL